MILHSDQEGNDCLQKLQYHCIQILHSDIYSVNLKRPGFSSIIQLYLDSWIINSTNCNELIQNCFRGSSRICRLVHDKAFCIHFSLRLLFIWWKSGFILHKVKDQEYNRLKRTSIQNALVHEAFIIHTVAKTASAQAHWAWQF